MRRCSRFVGLQLIFYLSKFLTGVLIVLHQHNIGLNGLRLDLYELGEVCAEVEDVVKVVDSESNMDSLVSADGGNSGVPARYGKKGQRREGRDRGVPAHRFIIILF